MLGIKYVLDLHIHKVRDPAALIYNSFINHWRETQKLLHQVNKPKFTVVLIIYTRSLFFSNVGIKCSLNFKFDVNRFLNIILAIVFIMQILGLN